MLIDTGADVTLLPLSVATEQGSISSALAAHAGMVFLDRRFRGQFLLIDQAAGIIGRNILNSASMLFDGPRLNWDRSSE